MTTNDVQFPSNVPGLYTYYLYLTAGCNLACQHCYIAPAYQANGGDGGHLEYDLIVQAVEEGIPLGLNNVKLTGGEPLLHPDFVRIVDYLTKMNLSVHMESNGTLLTESLAHHLSKETTVSQISVSLDGAKPTTHDAFRGVKGSFEKACQGIRYLVDAGYRPQIIMSPHAGNLEEVDDLVQLAIELGAGSVKFNPVQPAGRGSVMEKRGKLLNIGQLIKLGNYIDKSLRKRVSIPLLYSWPLAFRSLDRLSHTEGMCSILNILGIIATGHMAMCGVGIQEPGLCYGMVGKDSIRDTWFNSPLLIELRKKIPFELEGVCADCIFRNDCLGYCVAENYHSEKRLTAPFWFCQSAYQEGLFIRSRLKSSLKTS